MRTTIATHDVALVISPTLWRLDSTFSGEPTMGGGHLTRRGDLAVWPNQVAAASAPGAPCLGVLSLVCDTLELTYCTKLFYQTVHALSARSCKTRRYTNVVCCSLKIPPSKLSLACGTQGLSLLREHFGRCVKGSPLQVNTLEK